jgi:hypothetical protein
MILIGEKCSSGTTATLFSTNSTWNGLRSKPGLRNERPAADRLSHGTAERNQQSVRHIAVCIIQLLRYGTTHW